MKGTSTLPTVLGLGDRTASAPPPADDLETQASGLTSFPGFVIRSIGEDDEIAFILSSGGHPCAVRPT